jgi:methylenetetrahydrofolate--tRNA-(uracil-5-)-methyltransferase
MSLIHHNKITIIGAGLAGSEAALQLAKRGHAVTLYDMKPIKRSPAHHSEHYAEIVCSNSLGNLQTATASGLLKAELRLLDCELLKIAEAVAVPAGNALAVDRETFSARVTETLRAHPLITLVAEDVETIPASEQADYVILATGPLTSPGLSKTLQHLLNETHLAFYDAAAPIVTRDSINFDIAFIQDRYNKRTDASETTAIDASEEGAYINCPLNKDEYEALIRFILEAKAAEKKDFEKDADFFESCLPIEELARRGIDTPRYGPMKPVGLTDPRTGKYPYAAIQLRQDNQAGTLYNLVGFQTSLTWGAQKQMIAMIPGLENAEVVRYGVMHRNTYVNSPKVLSPSLELREHPRIQLAGQITGVEGYTECITSGLVAALGLHQTLSGETTRVIPPAETMIGALMRYITRDGVTNFQPINSNWGILPPLVVSPEDEKPLRKDKRLRNQYYAERALSAMQGYVSANSQRQAVAFSQA